MANPSTIMTTLSSRAVDVQWAQWKLNHELGFEDEPDEKKPRKKRGKKAADQLATAACSASSWQLQRVLLQPVDLVAHRPTFSGLAPRLPTAAAVPLPNSVSAAAFGVPVVRAAPLYCP